MQIMILKPGDKFLLLLPQFLKNYMNIAITGVNGHVGINLCQALHDQGHTIKGLVHKHTEPAEKLPIELIQGDLLNKDSLRTFLQNTDVCFHLAAVISICGDPEGMVRQINHQGTKNLVEIAMEYQIKKFIHFSSIHAFQQHPLGQLLDETRPLVTSNAFAYDLSKAEGERCVIGAVQQGLDAVVLSPTAIIGPEDFQPSYTGKAMLQIYNRKIPALVPGGYNWVDVRDVVDAAIQAIDFGKKGEKYLLSGHWASLSELSGLISEVTGKKTVQSVMPIWLAYLGLPFITAYSKVSRVEPLYTRESLQIISEGNQYISNEKAKKELNFHPRELIESIRDMFHWFEQTGFIH